MANDEFTARIEALLEAHGLRYRYARRRKHRSIIVSHEGRDVTFIYPASGSDVRGPRNLCAFIKRTLSLAKR